MRLSDLTKGLLSFGIFKYCNYRFAAEPIQVFSKVQAKNFFSALGQSCSDIYYAVTPDAVLPGARGIPDILKWERSMKGSLGF